MVLTSIAVLGAGIVLMYIVAGLHRVANVGFTLTSQTAVNGVVAHLLIGASVIGTPVGVVLVLMPPALRIVAAVWFYYIGKKVLNGDFGVESQWAAELVESGDEKFLEASNELTEMELRESGIVAETREELRESVIEKADEKNDES